jgi:hypothetical protein
METVSQTKGIYFRYFLGEKFILGIPKVKSSLIIAKI